MDIIKITSAFTDFNIPYGLVYLPEIDSTNSYAKKNIYTDSVVISSFQKKGRGRFERVWYSDKNKNVLMSIVLCNSSLPSNLVNFYLSVITYDVLKDFLKNYDNIILDLKWPNDILLNNKKIAGILSESVNSNNGRRYILGLGLNINQDNFPAELNNKVTSLKIETKKCYSIEDIIISLVYQFYKNIFLFTGNIIHEWKKRTFVIGKRIKFNNGRYVSDATVINIADDGSIALEINEENNSKKIQSYYSGEISFIY